MSAVTVPAKLLAKVFGLTQRRIQQLAQDGIIPKSERGEYPLLASVQGYVTFLQETSRKVGGDNEELTKHRLRLEKARADTAELELSLRVRELVFADEVQGEVSSMLANFRARLLALPAAIAAQGSGLDRVALEELVKSRVYEALHEFSGYNPGAGESSGDTA